MALLHYNVENMEIQHGFSRQNKNINQLRDLFENDLNIEEPNVIKLNIKRIMAISLSNLLYLRNILPETEFEILDYKDLKFKLLYNKESDESPLNKLIEDMFAFFHAFSNGSSNECMLEVRWVDIMQTKFKENYFIKIEDKDGLLELKLFTLDTVINTERLGVNEHQLLYNIKLMLRNVQIIAQLRNPLPDGTIADLDFNVSINQNKTKSYIKTESIKKAKSLPKNLIKNLEMFSSLFYGNSNTKHSNSKHLDVLKIMKQAAIIAVSTILYVREVFPNEAFKRTSLFDVEAPILHPLELCESNTIVTMIEKLSKFIKSLEKDICHELVIEILIGSHQEEYRMCFQNSNAGIFMRIKMPDKVRDFQIKINTTKEVYQQIINWNSHQNMPAFNFNSHLIVRVYRLPNHINQDTKGKSTGLFF